MPSLEKIREEALLLSRRERAILAERLIESLGRLEQAAIALRQQVYPEAVDP